MRLLLDQMWAPAIAAQLRDRGCDAQAVAERADLVHQPDFFIFLTAQEESRCIVTEDVAGFRALGQSALGQRQGHAGLVFTTDRRFPRHDPRTPGRLVTALVRLLSEHDSLRDREHWLN